jgi:hypothetical protein
MATLEIENSQLNTGSYEKNLVTLSHIYCMMKNIYVKPPALERLNGSLTE